jgi:enamine deaminase RidA (YjgF/YER057c/UK114 family)
VTTTPSGSKTYLSTPNPFELKFGYHRALKKGPFIFVSGTTALKFEGEVKSGDNDNDADNKSKVHFPDSAYNQAVLVMERCIHAVEELGGKRGDVVRVRMFVAVSQLSFPLV